MKIISNHVPRLLLYGYELTDKEKLEFDYLKPDELDFHAFFRYKDNVYDFSEFMRIDHIPEFSAWDGYLSDSFFSGILIKLCDCEPWWDSDRIIVGWYYT